MRKIVLMLSMMLALGATASLLTACNTTAGAGKDIEKAGAAINESAEENKSY